MPLIGVTNCRKLEDYRQSLAHAGGDVRTVDPSMTVAAFGTSPGTPSTIAVIEPPCDTAA